MIHTEKMKLEVLEDYLEGNVHQTISGFNNNFNKIDLLFEEKVNGLNDLVIGRTYKKAQKVWNNNPQVNSPIGWVNLREGKHTHKWEDNKSYNIGDVITPLTDNGHIYQCISRGKSSIQEPVFTVETGSEMWDLTNAMTWKESHNYELGDVVIPTDSSKNYHYRCVISGLSEEVEPEWTFQEGTTIVDGSVTWLIEKTAKWKEIGSACLFKPFGIIGEY